MSRAAIMTLLLAVVLRADAAGAVDGVIEVNQAKAAAGGINGNLVSDPPGFPVVITEPGSYRLTGSLSTPAFLGAITITAGQVSLDLSGFRVSTDLPAAGIHGIDATGQTDIRVSNGTIERFGGAGITAGDRARIENVTARSNSGGGISVGALGQVLGCRVDGNGSVLQASDGIFAGAASTVSGSTAVGNGGAGIHVLPGSIVNGNTANGNLSRGLFVGEGSTVSENSVSANTGDGITTDAACTVLHNTVRNNTGDGVEVGEGSAVVANAISANGRCGLHSSTSCAPQFLCSFSGWAHNVISANNGGGTNRQVFGAGLLQMNAVASGDVNETNVCSGSPVYPDRCSGGDSYNCP